LEVAKLPCRIFTSKGDDYLYKYDSQTLHF
jgi:hypothetical protein